LAQSQTAKLVRKADRPLAAKRSQIARARRMLALQCEHPQKEKMQSQNPIIADLVKLANSAAGTMAGMSREARESARERMREAFGGIDFVSREEFETVKAMAQKAREQADALEARLAALEAKSTK
jgi:BMFP domain-containing protein YqiC